MKSAGILIVLFLLPAAAVLFYLAGPSIDRSCDFSYPNLPESPAELESYFAARESSFSDLRPGTEKKIVWADRKSGAGGKNMAKTGFSIIYLHGFTASRMETEPVTSIVAENIGANVFFTRLKGHGHYQLSSQENVKLSDWLYDAAEALEAGKKTGEKVIVISCSSGAPLAAWLCSNYPSQIHAAVMISPNFSPADKRANIISYRWGPLLARLIEGEVAGDNEIVISPEHAAGWSYIYRTEMLFPMIALLEKASEIDYSAIEIPLMVFYSEEDKIVDHDATRKVFEMWGSGSKQLVKIENPGDRNSHIIAGDIFSPATTSFAAKKITEFLTR